METCKDFWFVILFPSSYHVCRDSASEVATIYHPTKSHEYLSEVVAMVHSAKLEFVSAAGFVYRLVCV